MIGPKWAVWPGITWWSGNKTPEIVARAEPPFLFGSVRPPVGEWRIEWKLRVNVAADAESR
jgi:hypothetical protein